MSKTVILLLILGILTTGSRGDGLVSPLINIATQLLAQVVTGLKVPFLLQFRELDSGGFSQPSVIEILPPFSSTDACANLLKNAYLNVKECTIKNDQIFFKTNDGILFALWQIPRGAEPDDLSKGIPSNAVPANGNF